MYKMVGLVTLQLLSFRCWCLCDAVTVIREMGVVIEQTSVPGEEGGKKCLGRCFRIVLYMIKKG